jgi:MFS family permease
MEAPAKSIFEKSYHPVFQASIALTACLVVMVLGKFLTAAGMEFTPRFPWLAIGAFVMCYAIFNSIFSLSAKDPMKYWGQSVMSYLGLAFIGGAFAWLFSGLTLNEAGSFRWIFVVLSIGYLVFLSMVNLMKKIVEFAMREDWQHPRLRSRKRK